MNKILFYLLFLTTCLFSFSNASRDIPNENIASTKVSAEELIKSFNLNPKHSAAIQSISITDTGNDEAKLVERPINIISSLSAGPSTAQLGHYAGYYQLPKTYGARFFYYFFESRHSKSDPVVIWLTGGPGCSSALALFYENGPFHLSKNMSLIWNDYGWDKASNIIFVDQPTGTGFSYSTDDRDIRHNEASVSNDLYNFLQGFFAKHPEYVANDFYITGESYAGHYVPALGGRVHQGNKANEGIHINLKGIAVGNGLTDPIIQYNSYADYGVATKLITTKSDYDDVNNLYPNCKQATINCELTSSDEDCQMAFSTCNEVFDAVRDINPQINYYDIRKICQGSLCYDFSGLEKYLNEKTVKEALGVPASIDFVSCSTKVYNAMIDDWVRNLEVGIPTLLEDGIKVLIYAGEYDLICNWLGNYRWVLAMEWSGQKDFVVAKNQSFIVDGKAAGVLQSHGDLSFLKVYNAGHMVPMDQPKAALEMLIRWTQGTLVNSNHK